MFSMGTMPLYKAMIGVLWWITRALSGSILTVVFLSIRLGFRPWQNISQSSYEERVERIFSVLVMGLLLKVFEYVGFRGFVYRVVDLYRDWIRFLGSSGVRAEGI